MDLLIVIAAVVAVYFILKIGFKILKTALLLGVAALVVYYLIEYGFLQGLF
ncbi:MAG: hypothetical protein ACOX22_05015 [Caldicoprobacterales bacterium]|jgi:hypothetical protein|nr:hypothetical protein [Clostridiales bacterium]